MHVDTRRSFACGSSALVRVEHEGGAAAWLVARPWHRQVAGTQAALIAGVTALSECFFEPLVAGSSKASLASFSIALPGQAL